MYDLNMQNKLSINVQFLIENASIAYVHVDLCQLTGIMIEQSLIIVDVVLDKDRPKNGSE